MKGQPSVWVAIVLLLVYIGGDIYTSNIAQKDLQSNIDTSTAMARAALFRASAIEAGLDSVKAKQLASIQAIIYLDSCQQSKAQKLDRAERRGKFVGGLIKSLFPGL
jgi:hypothetical protein